MPVQEQVLDAIKQMSVADLMDLVRAISAEMAIHGDTGAMRAADGAEAAGYSGATVSLRDFGADRIAVIKAVREMTDLALREARGLVAGPATGVADDMDNDEGLATVGVPAKPWAPLPSGEASRAVDRSRAAMPGGVMSVDGPRHHIAVGDFPVCKDPMTENDIKVLTRQVFCGSVIPTSRKRRSVAAIEGRKTWAGVDEIAPEVSHPWLLHFPRMTRRPCPHPRRHRWPSIL